MVPDLSVEVEVELADQNLVFAPRSARAAAAVRGSDVGRAVKGAHVAVRLLPVSRGESVGEDLGAYPVHLRSKNGIRDRGVAPLDGPQGLGQSPDGRDRVEDDLRAVEGERLPVERVVAAVADVDGDLGEAEVEDPEVRRERERRREKRKSFEFSGFFVTSSSPRAKDKNPAFFFIFLYSPPTPSSLTCARAPRSRARRTSIH